MADGRTEDEMGRSRILLVVAVALVVGALAGSFRAPSAEGRGLVGPADPVLVMPAALKGHWIHPLIPYAQPDDYASSVKVALSATGTTAVVITGTSSQKIYVKFFNGSISSAGNITLVDGSRSAVAAGAASDFTFYLAANTPRDVPADAFGTWANGFRSATAGNNITAFTDGSNGTLAGTFVWNFR
jgi:hypothetical protein